MVHTWKATQKCDKELCYADYPRKARSQPAQSAVNGPKWVSATNCRQFRHWNRVENTLEPLGNHSEITQKSRELLNESNDRTGLIQNFFFLFHCILFTEDLSIIDVLFRYDVNLIQGGK